MRSEDGFKLELKQLQEQFTEPPDPGLITPGDTQSIYKLSGEVKDKEVRINFGNNGIGDRWSLGVFRLPESQTAPLSIVKAEETAGGFQLEANAGLGDELTITVNGRWVQGRYLQLAREVVLNTLDGDRTLDAGMVDWTLHGPPVLLRMMPTATYSYGRM